MIGQKISHYKILEELGAGGMGIVFKAHDSRLNRTVALKFVVPRIIRKKEDRDRFIQEAQTAASLNHPSICTIYEIDEQEDRTFIAMEYIEGQSLKKRTEKRPLDVNEAIDTAVQIAEGLQEAHEKGIVHRDIKSSNIMMSRKGQAKITDFGLAKITRKAKLTETATIMGTVAYMSPEQASGENIDHRTDIWSFGVLLYEMLTGHLPFEGEHEQLVLYAILNQNPKPLSSLRSDIPSGLEDIVYKCLEKDSTERYQQTNELVRDLKQLKRETESGVISPADLESPRRVRKVPLNYVLPALLLFMIVAAAGGYFLFDWFRPPFKWKASIAVLPMENLSPGEENAHLCSGIPRTITSKLSLLSPELRVVSYESVKKSYRDFSQDIIKIGKEVNADHVLVSSLQSEGQTILIDARLIDIVHNMVINSFEYTKEQKEILALQNEISREIVKDLGFHFTEEGLIAYRQIDPLNVAAYDYYLEGMEIISKKDTYSNEEEWFTDATEKFENAIRLDPEYALAYWGLGSVYEAYYVSRNKEKDREMMLKNYQKAYNIDRGLAEANLGLGWAYFYMEEIEKAVESFKKALDISPDSELINCDVGAFLSSIGLYRTAIKYFSRAVQMNPSYLRAYEFKASCYWYTGKFNEGAEVVRKTIALENNVSRLYLRYARHLIMMNEWSKAEKAIEDAEKINPHSVALRRHRALLMAAKGEKDQALELIQGMEKTFRYSISCIYSMLGMKEKAIEIIKTGIEVGFEKNQNYLYPFLILKNHPCYNSLRDDPRFKQIIDSQKKIHRTRKKLVKKLL